MKEAYGNPKAARFEELDVLRGFAALWVLLFHYTVRYQEMYSPYTTQPFIQIPSGTLPVKLFFMISGFVIFMTLSRCRTDSDFVISRFTRLYPPYWGAIFLTTLVGLSWPLPNQAITLKQILVNLTMLQGYFFIEDVDGAYWSLTYELGFYLVMLAMFHFNLLRKVVWIAFPWIILGIVANTWEKFLWTKVRILLVLPYVHFFVAGIVFYQIWKGNKTALNWWLLAACYLAEWFSPKTNPATMIATGLFFMAFFLAVTGRLRFILVKPFVWLGAISYSLYLTHQMIGYRIIQELLANGMEINLVMIATISIALILASVMTYAIEKPVTRWLRQWLLLFQSRRQQPKQEPLATTNE